METIIKDIEKNKYPYIGLYVCKNDDDDCTIIVIFTEIDLGYCLEHTKYQNKKYRQQEWDESQFEIFPYEITLKN